VVTPNPHSWIALFPFARSCRTCNASIELVPGLDMTEKGSAMKKIAKQVTQLSLEQLEAASGGASGWRRIPRPRKPIGGRPK
jgi:hypothetical protein